LFEQGVDRRRFLPEAQAADAASTSSLEQCARTGRIGRGCVAAGVRRRRRFLVGETISDTRQRKHTGKTKKAVS
jgi:hypothetical protein